MFKQTSQLATRCEEFSAERELDSERLKTTLWDVYRIRLIIHLKQMWWEEKNMPGYDHTATLMRPFFKHRAYNIVYDASLVYPFRSGEYSMAWGLISSSLFCAIPTCLQEIIYKCHYFMNC